MRSVAKKVILAALFRRRHWSAGDPAGVPTTVRRRSLSSFPIPSSFRFRNGTFWCRIERRPWRLFPSAAPTFKENLARGIILNRLQELGAAPGITTVAEHPDQVPEEPHKPRFFW